MDLPDIQATIGSDPGGTAGIRLVEAYHPAATAKTSTPSAH